MRSWLAGVLAAGLLCWGAAGAFSEKQGEVNEGCGCSELKRDLLEGTLEGSLEGSPAAHTHSHSAIQCEKTCSNSSDANDNPMVHVEGAVLVLGIAAPLIPLDGEGPRRKVQVDSFSINKYEVSNDEFREFVADTGFVTESEKFGWSFVFESAIPVHIQETITQAVAAVPWWLPVEHAYWYQPLGPGSNVFDAIDVAGESGGQYPVVHVSWNDAQAFCAWKYPSTHGRLPTEAEWELASRGGGQNLNIDVNDFKASKDAAASVAAHNAKYTTFPWGDDLLLNNKTYMSNTYQGVFPNKNSALDGYEFMSPVRSFPEQNSLGLHNIVGNVWEWTSDWWETKHVVHPHYNLSKELVNVVVNKEGTIEEREVTFVVNPTGPLQGTDKVKKGGSFLCHHSYCNRYRIAARTQSTPDSATFNLGFRCASGR